MSNKQELSYSMFIDDYNIPITNLTKLKIRRQVEPKTIYHWIDDNLVTRCYQCGIVFGMFTRKHHCRNCGRIFCHNCSDKQIKLKTKNTNKTNNNNNTSKISKISKTGILSSIIFKESEKKRVCLKCYNKIKSLEEIEDLIKIFKYNNFLNIKDYFSIAQICKGWSKLALRYFSKFREIQYKLIDDKYDKEESIMLLNNQYFFSTHTIWKLQLINSINWKNINKNNKNTNIKNNIIKILLSTKKKCNCWNLMCSRQCNILFSMEDILIYLERDNIDNDIFICLFKLIKQTSISELSCYNMVLLQYCIKYKYYNRKQLIQQPIIEFFITKSKYSNEFIYLLIRDIHYFKYSKYKKLYNLIENILLESIHKNIKNKILCQNNFIEYLLNSLKKKYNKSLFLDLENYIKSSNIYKLNIPIITNPTLYCHQINIKNIKIKSSNSKPLIIPCIVKNNKGSKIKYEVLYKKEDLRKEKIIMNIIILMDKIFRKEEGINLNIIKYNIVPINCNTGFIEIITNSITLYDLKHKKFSIQNYIVENNSKRTINEIRNRFVNSCAAYCVITYMLGIGDRHLENIMITKSGLLFHIDYGFILGNEPKFLAPEIRITPDMIDAMGGLDSKYYTRFQNMCSKFYNCLRRHVNLFIIMLSMLYKLSPSIDNNKFKKEFIKKQIIKRFLPNENYEEAKLKFKTQVDNSHKSNYNNSFFIDFFHKGHSDKQIFKTLKILEKEEELTNSNSSISSNSGSNSGSGIFNFFWNKN